MNYDGFTVRAFSHVVCITAGLVGYLICCVSGAIEKVYAFYTAYDAGA